MTLQELQAALHARYPEAWLVPTRLLRRILRSDRQVLTRRLPHAFLYELPTQRVWHHVTRDELPLPPDSQLPEWLLLLPAPEGPITPETLFHYSRLLFHGAIHRQFRQRNLNDEEMQQRIAELGEVVFAEAREVLRQENRLFDEGNDREVYEEFASWFLELRQFAPEQVEIVFPACHDPGRVERLMQADIDAPRLYRESWLEGASRPAEPTPFQDVAADEPDHFGTASEQIKRAAEQARQHGNTMRAILLRRRAEKRGSTKKMHAGTRMLLKSFSERLVAALGESGTCVPDWQACLEALVEPAANGYWNSEARLLYDLQKVCVDLEKKLYAADLVEWLVTRGRRPIRRPLPDLPLVLAVKHLRLAQKRLPSARVEPARRELFAELLHRAEQQLETRLRDSLRPKIHKALDEAGLKPQNRAEGLSRDILIEELLDRILAVGALTLGDLRDAVARHRVKLADLTGPGELLRGDALLRANEKLAWSLDGITRRGEGYLRWMQTFSSVFFGTVLGRGLTLYLLLPLLASLFTLKGLDALILEVRHVAHWVSHLNDSPESPPPSFEDELDEDTSADLAAVSAVVPAAAKKAKKDILFHWWYSFLPLAGFYLLLFHVPRVRLLVGNLLWYGLWLPLRWLLYDVPRAVLEYQPLRRLLVSYGFQVFMRVVGRPALSTVLLLSLLYLAAYLRVFYLRGWMLWLVLSVWFGGVSIFLNTRYGRAFEEQFADSLARAWEMFHRDFLLGLWNYLVWLFRSLMDRMDQWLYSIDEQLRFRAGESQTAFVRKVILGFFWFGVVYLVRMIVILFVEPQINPIKHFPVVTVCHKLSLLAVMPLSDLTGIHPGYIGVVLGLIPGIFGFLAWELKENWRMYRANAPLQIEPQMVGSHGEQIIHYIRPGFHSGTLPSLYARYRRQPTGPAAGRLQEELHHVEQEIQRFVQRELIAPLALSEAWPESVRPRLGEIRLATQSIGVELLGPADQPVAKWQWLNQQGRLQVRWVQLGWLAKLNPEQQTAWETVLTNFWFRSGVEQVDEDSTWGQRQGLWSQWVQHCEAGLALAPQGVSNRGPSSGNENREIPALPSVSRQC